jgi:hypothetical protein
MKARQEQPNAENKEEPKVIGSGDIIIPNPESLNNWEVLGWEGEKGKGSLRVEETIQDKNKEGRIIVKKAILSIPEKNLPKYLEAEGVKIEKHSGVPRDLHEGDVITTGWGAKKQEYKISEVKADPDDTESGGGYFEFSRKVNGEWTNPAKMSFKDFYEKRTEPIEFIDKYNEKPKAKKEVPATKTESNSEPQIDKFVSETTKRSYDVHLDEEGWVITKKEDGKIMKLKPEEWERFRDRNKLELKQESQKPSKKEKDKKEKKSPGPTTRKGTGGKGKDYRMEDNEKEKAGPPRKIADLSNLAQGAKIPEGYMEMLKAESLAKPEVVADPVLAELDAIDERLRKYQGDQLEVSLESDQPIDGAENLTKQRVSKPAKAEKKIWNVPNVGDIITSRGGISRRVFAVDQDKELIGLEQTDTGDKTQMTFADYEKSKENIHNIQGRKEFNGKHDAARKELSEPENTLSLKEGQTIWTPSGEEVRVIEAVKQPKTTDESLKNGYAVLEFQPKQNADGTWRNEKVKREVVPFHKLLWAAEQGTLNLEKPLEKTSETERIQELKKELKVEEKPPEIVGEHKGKPVVEGEFEELATKPHIGSYEFKTKRNPAPDVSVIEALNAFYENKYEVASSLEWRRLMSDELTKIKSLIEKGDYEILDHFEKYLKTKELPDKETRELVGKNLNRIRENIKQIKDSLDLVDPNDKLTLEIYKELAKRVDDPTSPLNRWLEWASERPGLAELAKHYLKKIGIGNG